MAYRDLRVEGALNATIPDLMRFRGDYSALQSYVYGDVIVETSTQYVCISRSGSRGFLPSATPSRWKFAGGVQSIVGDTGISVSTSPSGVATIGNEWYDKPAESNVSMMGYSFDKVNEIKAYDVDLVLNQDSVGHIIEFRHNANTAAYIGPVAPTFTFLEVPSCASGPVDITSLCNKLYVDSVASTPGPTGPTGPTGATGPTGPSPSVYICSAIATASKQVAGVNTPTEVPHTALSTNIGGFSLSGTGIEVPVSGTYEVETSIQLDNTAIGAVECAFWFRVNTVDVPDSCSVITVQGSNGEVLANVSIILPLTAGDVVDVVIASPDADMTATFYAATTTPGDPYDRPAVPAIITNVKFLA